MTIGIVASGRNAGLAIIRGLRAVELVGTGSIGGFVSFVAISKEKELLRANTQVGGTATLFPEGEPPEKFASATIAALMSSGPNRPEPLSQFTPGEVDVGLVSGHRLPNAASANQVPINCSVLAALRAGVPIEEAIRSVLDVEPDADAGIVAVDNLGLISLGNSTLVERRQDIGSGMHHDPNGLSMGVIHNAIFPHRPLANLAIETARYSVDPVDHSNGYLSASSGVPVLIAKKNLVFVDENKRLLKVEVEQHSLALPGLHHGAAIPFHTEVSLNGQIVGHTMHEPYCIIENGLIRQLNGQSALEIPVNWRSA